MKTPNRNPSDMIVGLQVWRGDGVKGRVVKVRAKTLLCETVGCIEAKPGERFVITKEAYLTGFA